MWAWGESSGQTSWVRETPHTLITVIIVIITTHTLIITVIITVTLIVIFITLICIIIIACADDVTCAAFVVVSYYSVHDLILSPLFHSFYLIPLFYHPQSTILALSCHSVSFL